MRLVGLYFFYRLFYNCKNISDSGSLTLIATTLDNSCYSDMFSDCTNLTQAPALPATTLAPDCYGSMFSGCSSLTQAPVLPATTLADSCYSGMFSNCTNLTQAPALPATTLADYCYINMFSDCTNLTQAPTIKTYTPNLYAFDSMLYTFNRATNKWSLSVCNWPDLTLSEAESMILNEAIFGYSNPGEDVRISITCKDGSGIAYYNPENWSWVFEY